MNISLAAADATEPGQLLQFLDDWLATDHGKVNASLTRFVGSEAYRVESLRNDLARPPFHRALSTSEHAGIPALKAATAVSSPRRTFSLAELTADLSVRNVSPAANRGDLQTGNWSMTLS